MKRLLFVITLGISVSSFAQPLTPTPSWERFFKVIPPINDQTPDWARMMYGPDPNVNAVVDAYQVYYQTHPFTKNIHTQNYKYWLQQTRNYVDGDGYVRLPTEAEERSYFQKLNQRYAQRDPQKSMPWVLLGPKETYKAGTLTPLSQQVNVYSLDQSNSHPDILYAGSESGAMYKTIDRGLTWSETSYDEEFSSGYGALEIHPTNPDIVITTVNDRIYRTTNGGVDWDEVKYLGNSAYEVRFHPNQPDSVYCVGATGLFLSTNGGLTWGNAIFTATCHDIEFHPTQPDTIYLLRSNTVAKRSELVMSPNRGANWYVKDNGYYVPQSLANASIGGGKIAVTPADPDRVYVCLIGDSKSGDDGWIGVLRSDNRGETWTNPSGQYGGPYAAVNTMPWNVAAYDDGYHQGFYNFDMEASPTNADLIWIGSIRLTESSDAGQTFTGIGAANSLRFDEIHADIQDIEVNGNEVWVANDGGIEYSPNQLQTSYESRKNGIAGSNFWGFGAGWNEDVLVGGRYHNGNHGYYQTYGAGNGMVLGGVEESTGYVHPLDNKLAFFNQYWSGGTAMRSVPTALGDNYTTYRYLPLIPNESYSESSSSGLYFHPIYADWFYMGQGSSIWKSTDAGLSFQSLRDFGAGGQTLEIEISRKNPDYIYVVFKPNGTNARVIYRTSDGGQNWQQTTNVPTNNRNKLEITQNPDDELELWVACPDGNNGNKVFKTTDGGTTWVNMSTTALNGQSPKDIFYQGGTDDVVYVATFTDVFYYDSAQANWENCSNGLPKILRPLQMKPFYRDGKLRLATGGHGIWEMPLVAASLPQALPMALSDSVRCARDTVQLESYSIIAHAGATWQWNITPAPQWISSATARNPKVVFGANNNYTVTLTITDALHNTSSRTVVDMIKVNSQCDAEEVPGQALMTGSNSDYFKAERANLTNLTHFTVTGWWKPNGAQQAYAALFSSGDWCAHCDYVEGLVYDYNANKLWYRWPGNEGSWASNSGMTIPADEWSYVAMVITPTGATLYLNDQKYIHNIPLQPGDIQDVHIGYGHYSKAFKGEIDEVTMWDKALTEAEIRSLRHLTKADIAPTEPNLIGYWQFNKQINGTQVMDNAGKYHGALVGSASLATSSAPVGGGTSQTVNFTTNQYAYTLNDVGAQLWLSDCETPKGQLVATRLNLEPDQQPNALDYPDNYWIFNYYDPSTSFPNLDSLTLTPTDAAFVSPISDAEQVTLYSRSENAFGNTWQTPNTGKAKAGAAIGFDKNSQITGNQQMTLSHGVLCFTEEKVSSACDVDTIPGKAVHFPGSNGAYGEMSAPNLNTNTFTFSAWIKPDGSQRSNSGIGFCNGTTTRSGLNFSSTNTLRYHWDGGKWSWESGAAVQLNEWNHVALVVEPNRATIYLNGVAYVNTGTHAVEAFDGAFVLGKDNNFGDRYFKGWMDEVCIWNRSLSQQEIRALMHLTKEDILNTDPNLLVYLQFNEDDLKSYNKAGQTYHASLFGTAAKVSSTAPVGGGTSHTHTLNGSSSYTFGQTGVTLGFNPAATVTPTGDIVATRINLSPDTSPNDPGAVADNVYWVLNHYGAGSPFDALDSITFARVPGVYGAHSATPSAFSLFRRSARAAGTTWGSAMDGADEVRGSSTGLGEVVFEQDNSVTQLGQFVLGDNRKVGLAAKVFLEGPMDGTLMRDDLRAGNYLPKEEPFSGLTYVHKNGGGTEKLVPEALNTTGADAIVDWVVVELRHKNDPTQVLYTRSALLQRDGDVVDMDGVSALSFPLAIADSYYVGIQHRNHLGIMTAQAHPLDPVATTLNFADGSTATYGSNAQREVSGTYLMWAGDANQNGQVQNTDIELIWKPSVGLSGYRHADFNLNGQVQNTDLEAWWKKNVGLGSQIPY